MQTARVSAARPAPTARDARLPPPDVNPRQTARSCRVGYDLTRLTLVSHAIVPNPDDACGSIPDGGRTTIRGRAIRDARPNRRRWRANWGTPRPIRDDGARPIRGGVRATDPRRAIRDARPNHRNLAHVRPPAQPRRRLSGQRRRILFEVSFPVPPG